MELHELPESVQVVAAQALAKKLDVVPSEGKMGTVIAKEIAETVREAFKKLYND